MRKIREILFERALELGYSEKEIEKLRLNTNNWNQDNITNEILDSIRGMEQYINDNGLNKINKEGLFSRIGAFVKELGENNYEA